MNAQTNSAAAPRTSRPHCSFCRCLAPIASLQELRAIGWAIPLSYDRDPLSTDGALCSLCHERGAVWALVTSSDGVTQYEVRGLGSRWSCTCEAGKHNVECRHVKAARVLVTPVKAEPVTVSEPTWPRLRRARQSEWLEREIAGRVGR